MDLYKNSWVKFCKTLIMSHVKYPLLKKNKDFFFLKFLKQP